MLEIMSAIKIVLNQITIELIASLLDFMLLAVSLAFLVKLWRVAHMRWTLMVIIALESINLLFSDYFRDGEWFFFCAIGVDILFIFLITLKKHIAKLLSLCEMVKLSAFFSDAYRGSKINKNELALVGVYFMALCLSLITFIEGQAYGFYLIDEMIIREYAYQPIMVMFQVMLSVNLVRMALCCGRNCN